MDKNDYDENQEDPDNSSLVEGSIVENVYHNHPVI